MTRSCAAPPRRRSSSWRARPAPPRCTSPRPHRRCAFPTSTASTCRPPASWWPAGARVSEVARLIGADWLIYQDLDDLIAACKHEDARIEEFDTSCFSGEYVTGDITPEYLERLQLERSDAAKVARRERHAQAQNRPRDLAGGRVRPAPRPTARTAAGGPARRGRTPLRARRPRRRAPRCRHARVGGRGRQGGSLAWRSARTRHSAAPSATRSSSRATRKAPRCLAARPDVQIADRRTSAAG